jgi:hypothetical protein
MQVVAVEGGEFAGACVVEVGEDEAVAKAGPEEKVDYGGVGDAVLRGSGCCQNVGVRLEGGELPRSKPCGHFL